MAKKQTATSRTKSLTIQRVFPYILIVAAIVGFTASFVLTLDHLALLKDPNHQLDCNLNPVLSCGPVMVSKPATILVFPNPLMGIASFAVMGLLGVIMLAGAKMKSWFWKLYSLSVIGSVGFSLYLIYESLFVIKAICIYCLSVWIVLFASSWYTLQYMLAEKHLKMSDTKTGMWLRKHHGEVLVVIYLVLLVLILREFWYYYGPKFGL